MNEHIEELLTRGVSTILPDKKALSEKLSSGQSLNVYLGIDPTFPKIHLGHSVLLRKLQKFSEAGHNVTFLIGDFTARIGDTSDKESERPALSEDEIQKNIADYQSQAGKIINFEKVSIKFNSEWLSQVSIADALRLLPNFTLGEFVGRELIKKRMNEGKRVGLQELLYPFLQGYDSYMLDTDIQIGGSDQIFNMQAGRTLNKTLRNKESFVLTTEILPGTDGRKMSKSWGNAIWLDDSPEEMFGKVMSIEDGLIVTYFELATNFEKGRVEEIKHQIDSGQNPMDLKKVLAKQIVTELHSEDEAEHASDTFRSVIQEKQIPQDLDVLTTNDETAKLSSFLTLSQITQGTASFQRLVEQGGVDINGQRLNDPYIRIGEIPQESTVRIGRKYVKIKR